MQMHKSCSSRSGRGAWNILRLALLWARKGGVFGLKKKVVSHFLSHSHKGNGALQYGDRQLSFDATPVIHVRMHRPNSMPFRLPHIPCINPHLTSTHDVFDFDHDLHTNSCDQARNSFLIHQCDDEEEEEEGIDIKADHFIANFYEQLKLQRQLNATNRITEY